METGPRPLEYVLLRNISTTVAVIRNGSTVKYVVIPYLATEHRRTAQTYKIGRVPVLMAMYRTTVQYRQYPATGRRVLSTLYYYYYTVRTREYTLHRTTVPVECT